MINKNREEMLLSQVGNEVFFVRDNENKCFQVSLRTLEPLKKPVRPLCETTRSSNLARKRQKICTRNSKNLHIAAKRNGSPRQQIKKMRQRRRAGDEGSGSVTPRSAAPCEKRRREGDELGNKSQPVRRRGHTDGEKTQ